MTMPYGCQARGDFTDPAAIVGWHRDPQIVAPDRFARAAAPTPSGRPALRVTVKPGDDPIGSSGERAELAVMLDGKGAPIPEGAAPGPRWFGFSYRFPPGYAGTDTVGDPRDWGIVAQLHGPDALSASPAFALNAGIQAPGQAPVVSVSLLGGRAHGRSPARHRLAAGGAIVPGAWNRKLVCLNFQRDPVGHLEVWDVSADNRLTLALMLTDIPTLQYGDDGIVGAHYWKQGLYRGVADRTDTLDMEPIVRGNTAACVLAAMN